MMSVIVRAVAVGLVLNAAGCGRDTGTRAATGGLIGAGGGVALGVATGGLAPAVGALVGGGVGATAGPATSERTQRATTPNHVVPPQGTREPIVNAN
jgi:osmotically inducible lipoprotein OsmB